MPRHRAILDPDGVYQGHEPFTGRARAADVMVPPDCDLPAGKYRWDGKTFLPIRDAGRHDLLDEPHTLRSVANGFAAIDRKWPDLLPAETKAWLAWFKTTIDAK
jgi:hypothetical protein